MRRISGYTVWKTESYSQHQGGGRHNLEGIGGMWGLGSDELWTKRGEF